MSGAVEGEARWFGATGAELALGLGVPQVEVHASLPSTNDRAHALALVGAPAGTVVLAVTQSGGRGRHGRRWSSVGGAGVWCSVIERPRDPEAVRVLALRVGLALADRLESLAGGRAVSLKWPNDVFLDDGKVAGILLEARWTDNRPSHVVLGVGCNLARPDDQPQAAALGGAQAHRALAAVIGACRAAAAPRGGLTDAERSRWQSRDRAVGRRIVEPAVGTVLGITPDGSLEVDTADGRAIFHAGSLVFA